MPEEYKLKSGRHSRLENGKRKTYVKGDVVVFDYLPDEFRDKFEFIREVEVDRKLKNPEKPIVDIEPDIKLVTEDEPVVTTNTNHDEYLFRMERREGSYRWYNVINNETDEVINDKALSKTEAMEMVEGSKVE